MPTTWDSVNTVCPFYYSEDSKSIKCEGVLPESLTKHEYKRSAEKLMQKDIFCNGCYEKCEFYRALIKFKYDDN